MVRVSRITDVVAINDPLAEIKVIAKDFNDRTSEEGVVYFFRTTEGWKIHYAYSFFPSKLVELVAADLEETEFCSRLNKEDLVIVATGQSVQSGCLVEQHKYKGFSTYVKND